MSIKTIPKKYVFVSDTQPSAPFEGQLWYNPSSDEVKYYDGSSFVNLSQVTKSELEQIIGSIKQNSYQLAETRKASSLAQYNADGGFYDVFIDQSKISSNNGTTVSTSSSGGYIESDNLPSDSEVNASNPNSSSSFTTDATAKVEGIVTKVQVDSQSSGFDWTAEIKQDGTTLASKTTNHGGSNTTLTFSGSDYSSKIDPSLNGGDFKIVHSTSPSNSIFYENKSWNNSYWTNQGSSTPIGGSGGGGGASSYYGVEEGKVKFNSFSFTDISGNVFSPDKIYYLGDVDSGFDLELLDSGGNVVKTFTPSDIGSAVGISTNETNFSLRYKTKTSSIRVQDFYLLGV